MQLKFDFWFDDYVEEIVAAVRQDEQIGRGTCTYVDETRSDEELANELAEFALSCATSTAKKREALAARFIRHLKAGEEIIRDREADVRGSAF